MPCFNAAHHISRGIHSALAQTFRETELIVVDDGSTDDSLKILAQVKDPRLRVFTQAHKGVSAARNLGIREANGSYIAFLDADDTWHPCCLEKLYAAIEKDPSAVLVYCGWQNVGLTGGQGKPYIPPDYEDGDKWVLLLKTCPWPIHAALSRREVVCAAGGFKEGLAIAEDYRLWLDMASRGRVVRVPEVLAYYHFHEGAQATKNRARAAYDQWSVQSEFLESHPEIVKELGVETVRKLTLGELLKRGYVCYWDRDLEAARMIFRLVMKSGYGTIKDWKYMLPALLPLAVHRAMIRLLERETSESVC
jgi:glycosyltransferase involved in cell wall biosynthesis